MAAAGFYREDLNRIPLVLGVSQFIQVVSFSCLDVGSNTKLPSNRTVNIENSPRNNRGRTQILTA
jgi:hypothetical protein